MHVLYFLAIWSLKVQAGQRCRERVYLYLLNPNSNLPTNKLEERKKARGILLSGHFLSSSNIV
jgi:hypothetical protein